MTIWIDAHLSPAIATWITTTFGITAFALHNIDLRDAEDREIFEAAKAQGIIFMTKDSDFADLVYRLGSPPQIIWVWEYFKCSIARDSECNAATSTSASTDR
jgi:predicted nuclease of predicted toxin-antitoxin system